MTAQVVTQKTAHLSETQLLNTLSSRGQNIFGVRDAERVLHKPNAAVRKILQNLTKQNWLQRIEKGKYLIVPSSAGTDGHYAENELVIAAHLIAPYYISYWSALYHYSLTEQPVRTVFVATTQRRRSLTLNGITYRFTTLTRRKFFGHTRVWIGDQAVEIADPTKVLVDGLDHPELCGGIVEVAKGLWHSRNEINWKKMETYAERMGNRAIFKRLGYLLETFDLGNANLRERLKKKLSAGYVVLDPLSPRQGIHTLGGDYQCRSRNTHELERNVSKIHRNTLNPPPG